MAISIAGAIPDISVSGKLGGDGVEYASGMEPGFRGLTSMSDRSTALIAAVSGLVGVMAGSAVAAYGTITVAKMQLDQATMTTRASSALSMRSTLAEKSAAFFSANEEFLALSGERDLTPSALSDAAHKLTSSASQLYPYLDGDLLNACRGITNSVSAFIKPGDIPLAERKKTGYEYVEAYKNFQILYLRLKRELEKNALVDALNPQIDDKFKSGRH